MRKLKIFPIIVIVSSFYAISAYEMFYKNVQLLDSDHGEKYETNRLTEKLSRGTPMKIKSNASTILEIKTYDTASSRE